MSQTTPIFLFPGQSSRQDGMLEPFLGDPRSETRIAAASEILGENLRHRFSMGGSDFSSNRDIQIGVFLTNHLSMCRMQDDGLLAHWSAGLSLGEYNHLVHIGALTFEDGLRLVAERGRLYDGAPAGVMVTLFPCSAEEARPLVQAVRGDVWLSNINSPNQVVIAGTKEAVEAVCTRFENLYMGHAMEIEPRVPMHTPLLSDVRNNFAAALSDVAFRTPHQRYVPNVLARPLIDVGPADIRALLAQHVTHPVLWRDTVEWFAASVPSASFVEVGPGKVLTNMLRRRWISAPCHHWSDTVQIPYRRGVA